MVGGGGGDCLCNTERRWEDLPDGLNYIPHAAHQVAGGRGGRGDGRDDGRRVRQRLPQKPPARLRTEEGAPSALSFGPVVCSVLRCTLPLWLWCLQRSKYNECHSQMRYPTPMSERQRERGSERDHRTLTLS